MKRPIAALAATIALSVGVAAPVVASTSSPKTTSHTLAQKAHKRWCKRHPVKCRHQHRAAMTPSPTASDTPAPPPPPAPTNVIAPPPGGTITP